MRRPHLLTILYVNQQSINKVPKIWGQQNEKGNGGSPDPFLARLRRALRKKGLACETSYLERKPEPRQEQYKPAMHWHGLTGPT